MAITRVPTSGFSYDRDPLVNFLRLEEQYIWATHRACTLRALFRPHNRIQKVYTSTRHVCMMYDVHATNDGVMMVLPEGVFVCMFTHTSVCIYTHVHVHMYI